MNIVGTYIKFNNQLIIIVSGLSGSGKTKIAMSIAKLFKINHINIDDYCVPDHNITVKLPNDVIVKDWDHIDSYDWDKINNEINKNKQAGIVICGQYLPKDKLKFDPDFHIHVKISKQQLIENRRQYVKDNPEKCKDIVKFINTPTETMIINQIVYPHYLDYLEKSKVDKFINSKDMTFDQIYDSALDFLFNKIEDFLKNKIESTPKQNDSPSSSSSSDKITSDTVIHLGTDYDQYY